MKFITVMIFLMTGFSRFAQARDISDAAFERCTAKAVENVEAVSKIAYDGQLDKSSTTVLSARRSDLSFEVYTRVPGTEGLNCIYKVQMNANVLEDCMLISLFQSECGA